MSKAEETKQYIIERSSVVFNKKGYTGTSLADIMEATSLTKGSIYGNFENKDEVAIAVYRHNIYYLRKRIAAEVALEKTATAKLLSVTNYYRKNWKMICERGGCPILNASIEADDHVSVMKKPVQESIKNFVKDISFLIEFGQKKKEFKATIDPTEYAYVILTMLEGCMMLLKIMNNQHLLFSTLDRIDQIIHTEIKK